jgi:mono/diheme cytochrome c family protein
MYMVQKKSIRYAVAAALLLMIGGGIAAGLFWPERLPPPPDIGRLHASVDKGRYLATVANCVSCHTAKGGAPFAGGVEFRTPFGVMYSTNITGDAETGIGGWSFGDFYQSMKHGVRPDGTHLYPAFPYTSFARMTDADIASIYLYMKTIEPVPAPARPNELKFPYNLRIALQPWKKLFHDADTFVPDAAQSSDWNRGAYLVQGPGHCGACHTPRNVLGAERDERALTGGVLMDEVSPGKFREWSAVNLTPTQRGLAAWSADDIVAYLKKGENERAVVHGPMNEVVMNSTRYLDQADAYAIASYLKGISANTVNAPRPPNSKQLAAGEIAYTVHCGTCHLPTGLGDQVLGVSLAGNAIVQAADPASLINVILYGPDLPPPPFVAERTRMKPFGKRLSAEDIADLATYLRANFGNQAGPVTANQVMRQR